jgi:hypothetical protein
MKRDEEHVRSLIDHVKNNMTDPFDVEACPKDLNEEVLTFDLSSQ